MGDNFRKSIMNRLPAMPPPMAPTRAPWAETTGDDVEELEEGDGVGELGMPIASSSRAPTQDLSPLSASGYFEQALEVHPPGTEVTFRVYMTPPTLTKDSKHGTYLVCHHGAGAGGLSFAALAKEVKLKSNGELGVLAYDCRGHGKTRGPKETENALHYETLLADLWDLIRHLFPEPKEAPAFVLLGHSMGAAPITGAVTELQMAGYTVSGVGVIDVVEGTALEALPLMRNILSQRPSTFRSVVDGIQWHLASHAIRNTESARVSVPSYLVPSPAAEKPGPESKQIWRTDLLATEPYWEEWYTGLSSRFVSAKCARLLVLAGQERLDKELMVGQMQGKFQLEVLPDVGHYLHEDNPSSLAQTLVTFWKRNTRVLVLPPKIGSTGPSTGVEVKRVGET